MTGMAKACRLYENNKIVISCGQQCNDSVSSDIFDILIICISYSEWIYSCNLYYRNAESEWNLGDYQYFF